MIYDANNINIEVLKQDKSLFNDEKSKFEKYSYEMFLSSYLNNSNDEYIKLMANKLEQLYKNIQKDYELIYDWFNDYVQNVSSLEKSLSDDFGTYGITESTIRNFVNFNLKNKM